MRTAQVSGRMAHQVREVRRGRPHTRSSGYGWANRLLLVGGIGAPVVYLATNVAAPLLYKGYSVASQTVSELSAINAPTRPFWLATGWLYTLLLILFGVAAWFSAGGSKPLKIAAGALVTQGLIDPFWPPMHMRGEKFGLTDTMHIVFSAVCLLLMLLAMTGAAVSLGKGFRTYTIATIAVFLVFGVLTGLDSPGIAANQPTPLIGIWERVNICAYMLWLAVFATTLVRERRPE